MARSALQLVTRYQKAAGKNLKEEIDDLAAKGLRPPVMKEWSHEIRLLGNENAHPAPGAKGTNQGDARDVVEFLSQLLILFLSQLLILLYNLPNDIDQFRKRKGK